VILYEHPKVKRKITSPQIEWSASAQIPDQSSRRRLLFFADHTRYPLRNQVHCAAVGQAGLRAAEIANLTWTGTGRNREVATALELHDRMQENAGELFQSP